MKRIIRWIFIAMVVSSALLFTASGCRPATVVTTEHEEEHEHPTDGMPPLSLAPLRQGERLKVVATTSIVADVVQNVGGDLINLTMLMPLGTDPHAFEPTPQDVVAVANAHVVFINGAGLEVFLEPLLESAGKDVTVVHVSYGIELLQLEDEHEHKEESGHDVNADPHVWFAPHNVTVWAHNIGHTLSTLDPDNAQAYEANAQTYEAELEALDIWIQEQVAQIPKENRRLVTDHTSFGYFSLRYGFEQTGAVFPSYSTLAEPSARDLAALEDTIREFDVKAVFVGLTVNPDLAQRVADDTGIRLVFLYTGSLSEPGGPADDYLSFMRYNVSEIVKALR